MCIARLYLSLCGSSVGIYAVSEDGYDHIVAVLLTGFMTLGKLHNTSVH